MKITLPKWYDLHTHLRQGALIKPIIQSQIDMGCAGLLAMPNTKPPCAKVQKSDDLPYWSLEEYQDLIRENGGNTLQVIITPLYLTKDTSAEMIENGAKSGLLKACKYYPPHGTTGADFGYPFEHFMENGVFKAMEENGIILCIHGEQHAMKPEEYFDRQTNAEELFYTQHMPKLIEKFPNLKIACEHVTTKIAVDFVQNCGSNVAASITPQHLLYTVGHLLQGLKYHLYCLPLLKYEQDREALRTAATAANNTKFYAGTDSAPHTTKATPCGCAAGCFTGAIAPQLYAQGFEESGLSLNTPENQTIFENFLCHVGKNFYGLPEADGTFTLTKEESTVEMLSTEEGNITPLPLGLGQNTIPWKISLG